MLIRADLNVPVKDGKVTSDARITASMPTVEHCMKAGAKVMVMSHRGRPEEGKVDEENSMQPIADDMSAKLGREVRLIKDYLEGGFDVAEGEVVLLENVRFNAGEKKDDEALSKKYAALCDVFVMDAFGTAHRAQASTHGAGKFAPVACAGLLLSEELDSLAKALAEPARPMVAIVGGSKVSTKLTVLEALSEKVDQLVVGGGIANTFLKAMGNNVGKSLCEDDLVDTAKALIEKMKARGASIPIATDVVCGKEFSETAEATLKAAGDVADDDMIFDIGPEVGQRTGRDHSQGRHHRLERSGRRVRVRSVRRGHQDRLHGDRQCRRLQPGRWRRHHRGDPEVRHLRQGVLHLHRGRRLPRVPRGQDPAGGSHAGRSGRQVNKVAGGLWAARKKGRCLDAQRS